MADNPHQAPAPAAALAIIIEPIVSPVEAWLCARFLLLTRRNLQENPDDVDSTLG